MDSMGGRSGSSTPHCSTPVRERASPFGDRERNSPFSDRPPSANSLRSPISPSNNLDMPSSMVSFKLKIKYFFMEPFCFNKSKIKGTMN